MKKVELLCPAGNKKMLEMVIHNGADAVYLAGTKFGARKFANNFSDSEIIEAINFAHLYGVKVYITINTLIKDTEVEEFLNFIEYIHKNGVDAVLMQDLGMINLVRNIYPNLEIHASTQFHNHNEEGLKFLHDKGVKRVVLAREMSLDNIKKLNTDIEKEVFVHGALCICYSGQCLMSSMVMNRSGNRGECSGMCRLPYKLFKDTNNIKTDGDYLISTKELCTLENINSILDANIDSIKIEGRMKSPECIGYITKLYRKAIDCYYNNQEYKITSEEIKNLKKLFNREFTKGYILNDDENIINEESPNHKGIEIGKVENITKRKIKIKLSEDLYQGDAIRFKYSNKGMYVNFIYNKYDKLINKAQKNEVIYIDNKLNIDVKNEVVLKTIDTNLINEINNYPLKKIPVDIKVKVKIDNPFIVEISDGNNKIIKNGKIVTKAVNQSLTKEIIKEKFSKLGNTIYELNNLNIDLDNDSFIPIKELNELRRILVEELNNIRTNNKKEFIKNKINFSKSKNITLTKEFSLLIDKEEDYLNLKNNKNIIFYTDNINIYEKYKNNNNIFYRLPRIIDNFLEYKNENLLCNDIGSINKYKSYNTIYSGIYFNVTNIYTVKYLTDLGVKKIGLSPELSIEESINLYNNYVKKFNETPNLEIFAFGKLELMILKYSIIKENKNDNSYYIQDRNKEKYKIIRNKNYNIVLNYKNINNINELDDKPFNNYYISFIDLNNEEKEIIKELIERRTI